jgi:hypothetical protein
MKSKQDEDNFLSILLLKFVEMTNDIIFSIISFTMVLDSFKNLLLIISGITIFSGIIEIEFLGLQNLQTIHFHFLVQS